MVFFFEGEAGLVERAIPGEGVFWGDPDGVLAVFGEGVGGFEGALDVVECVAKRFAEVWDDDVLPVFGDFLMGDEGAEAAGEIALAAGGV